MMNKADFLQVYAKLSDARLADILAQPQDYTADALEAAEETLRSRGIEPRPVEADWTQIELEREEADVKDASMRLKFVFFFFPNIGFIVAFVWFVIAAVGKSDRRVAQVLPFIVAGFVFWFLIAWLFMMVLGTSYRY